MTCPTVTFLALISSCENGNSVGRRPAHRGSIRSSPQSGDGRGEDRGRLQRLVDDAVAFGELQQLGALLGSGVAVRVEHKEFLQRIEYSKGAGDVIFLGDS